MFTNGFVDPVISERFNLSRVVHPELPVVIG